jgi:hypothetical protein
MEINSNLSTNGVNASVSAARSTPAQKMPSDRVSLTNLSGMEDLLQNIPSTRPDVVERAKSLIADPNYPSSAIMGAVAQHLAVNLKSENQ